MGGQGSIGRKERAPGARKGREGWTFLTNHAGVLLAVFEDPELRLRDIAERVEITERAAHQIITDLESEGYITVKKVGRRNVYEVSDKLPLRRSGFEKEDLRKLISTLATTRTDTST